MRWVLKRYRPAPLSHQTISPTIGMATDLLFPNYRRVKTAFCPPHVREFRVAQDGAPRLGKPVPRSPAESRAGVVAAMQTSRARARRLARAAPATSAVLPLMIRLLPLRIACSVRTGVITLNMPAYTRDCDFCCSGPRRRFARVGMPRWCMTAPIRQRTPLPSATSGICSRPRAPSKIGTRSRRPLTLGRWSRVERSTA